MSQETMLGLTAILWLITISVTLYSIVDSIIDIMKPRGGIRHRVYGGHRYRAHPTLRQILLGGICGLLLGALIVFGALGMGGRP